MVLDIATFLSFLTASCAVRRAQPSVTDGHTGLVGENWSDLVENVPCRFVNRKGSESFREARGAVARQQLCMLPIGTDVREGDVITSGGLSYDVKLVDDAAGAGHHLEALVERRS